MWQSEHYSKAKRSERNMENFRLVLSDCKVYDLGFKGPGWTYNNKQDRSSNVRAHLDRCVASSEWSDYFNQATVEHICSSRSDHLPILLRVGGRKEWRPKEKGSAPTFRYEHMWERVESFQPTIKAAWKEKGPAANLKEVCSKLNQMKGELRSWENRDFGSVIKQSADIRSKLSRIWNSTSTPETQKIADELARNLDELLLREELMWRQRSRATYLREGDKNTKWFQQKATWRRKKNTIGRLKDDSGKWVEDDKGIHEITNVFFKKLYEKEEGIDPNEILDLIGNRVNGEMNDVLTKQFSAEEISDALFQIGPLKAPGPDGFPGRFFQRNWGELKEDVIRGVLEFFESGVLPDGINDTVIVLIQRVMIRSQSRIIGRSVCATNVRDNYCAYKLDLAKAYDRVDWDFLEGVLRKFGFCKKWTDWVMQCVRTMRYSVRCNGGLLEPFIPSRGLRQGDPLSPYMFLFVADGLVHLLKKEIAENNLTPIKIARNSPGISNLLFADDSLIFFKATTEQAKTIKRVLTTFQRCTGQLLSESKCSILFSEACPEATRAGIKNILGVQADTFESKYLGLPTPEGRMKDDQFQPILDRFGKRCNDWSERFMSYSAKEVHVKSVVQGLPTYTMNVFMLSKGFCEKYERMIRDFWWGEEDGHRKVHWMSWDRMTKPKRDGGIGFRDMHLFNQALLAKQGWRLIQNPNSLCARVLKSKYYPNGNVLDTVYASDVSPVWRGIEFGLQLLKKGIIWRVGDGKSIQIQRDQWLPRREGLMTAAFIRRSRLRWVNQLMIPDRNEWNVDLIRQIFYPFDADEICKLPIPSSNVSDQLAWHYERNGAFTVKSAYKLAAKLAQQEASPSSSTRDADDRSIWDLIWKAKVPGKVRIFGWRVATKTLATKENKHKRTLETDATCSICGRGVENEYHAIVECTKSRGLRRAMREVWVLPPEKKFRYTGEDWLQVLLDSENEDTGAKMLLLMWRCWHLREDCVRIEGRQTISSSVQFLEKYEEEFRLAGTEMDVGSEGKTAIGGRVPEQIPEVNFNRRWVPPVQGTVKLNTDAAFEGETGVCAAGVIARDERGRVLFAESKGLPPSSGVDEAEARAALVGLHTLAGRYNGRVILEMDNQSIVKEVEAQTQPRSACYGLIMDIRRAMESFSACKISHVKRCSNALAHGLAALHRSYGDQRLDSDVPPSLQNLMYSECVNP
nr:uncharacterized protein LOC123494096 [Aegilops tauschii subsp. strangulata]